MFSENNNSDPPDMSTDDDEPNHPEFRNPDGTFNGDHPWAFKPGESGNPSGKKKGDLNFKKLTDLMRHIAQQKCTKKGLKKLTWGEALVLRTFDHAIERGTPRLVREILDRIDGTVLQVHEVEAKTKTIIEYVIAQPPDQQQHEENEQNGKLNGTTKKDDE